MKKSALLLKDTKNKFICFNPFKLSLLNPFKQQQIVGVFFFKRRTRILLLIIPQLVCIFEDTIYLLNNSEDMVASTTAFKN